MHKHDELSGTNAREICALAQPFGPGAPGCDLAKIERVEIWASGIKDDGDDYCEFRTFDARGNALKTYRVEGY